MSGLRLFGVSVFVVVVFLGYFLVNQPSVHSGELAGSWQLVVGVGEG